MIEVHLEMLHTKYQSFKPLVSEKKNIEIFLSCSYVPFCDPAGIIIMNELGRGLLEDAPYQIAKLYAV